MGYMHLSGGSIETIYFAFTTTGTTVSVKSTLPRGVKFRVVSITPISTVSTVTNYWVTTTSGADTNGFYTLNSDQTLVINRVAGTDSGMTGIVTLATR